MRRRVWLLLGSAGLAGSLAAAGWLHPAVGTGPHRAPARAAAAPSAVPPAGADVLAATAQVRVVARYPACGVRRVGSGPLPLGLIGLTAAQAAAAVGPETVTAFSPELLVMERTFSGCPGDTVTLIERDGVVVALAGPPGDTGGVVQRTAIPVRALSGAEAMRLEAGVAVPATGLPAQLARLAREAGVAPTPAA